MYLSGQMLLDAGDRIVEARAFPGRQGREAFALLVVRHREPVSRDELAAALWGDALPASWDTALRSILSRLRSLLGRLGLDGGETLRSNGGCYELHLPTDAWIDQEVAFDNLHRAEAALAAGDMPGAYGTSAVARHILQRAFLPGAGAEWIEVRRERLQAGLVRALECRAAFYLWNGEHNLAVESASGAVALAPFRESAYRLLMQAYAAAGNAAEGLRVYEQCRQFLAAELGVSPSEPTKRARDGILATL